MSSQEFSSARAKRNPSRASKRVAIGAIALLGAGIAARLTLFQLGLSAPPWEPFFGNGTRRVLTSAFSRALPFPDSALGLFAYLAEIFALSVGGSARWRSRPLAVYAYTAIAFGMALGSAALVVLQIAFVHAFCTLCLASALISFVLVVPAATEFTVAWKERKMRWNIQSRAKSSLSREQPPASDVPPCVHSRKKGPTSR